MPHGIEAQHPDAFLTFLAGIMPAAFLVAAHACLERLNNPPIAAAVYLKNLRDVGLVATAAWLESEWHTWNL
jgi:hypothetical protein